MFSNGDPSAIHWSHADEFKNAAEKSTPIGDDEILLEDSEDSKKKKRAKLSSLPGGASALDDLSDVDTSGVQDGDALVYDSGTWVPGGGGAAYHETVGDTSETTFSIEHNLDTTAVVVGVIEVSSGDALVHGVDFSWLIVDENEISVTFQSAPGNDDALIVVLASGGTSSGGGGASSEWSPWLDTKDTADTPDDDFSGSALDAKWTVAAGSAGTVGFLTTTDQGIYDLATRPALLVQTRGNGNHVRLRQSYTLPDGKSIIAKLIPGSWSGSSGNNVAWTGIGLNASTTAPDTGTHVRLLFDAQAGGLTRYLAYDGSNTLGESDAFGHPTTPVYLRIHRSGTSYLCFVTTRGDTWIYMGSKTISPAADTVWLYQDSLANAPSGAPGFISYVEWVRLGGDGLDPW